jgi:hypothetical protein
MDADFSQWPGSANSERSLVLTNALDEVLRIGRCIQLEWL